MSAVQGPALWVGALLEAAQVDPWGKFKFLLLRMKDRNGRQMLLVRGSNNATDAKIVEELHREVREGREAAAEGVWGAGVSQAFRRGCVSIK